MRVGIEALRKILAKSLHEVHAARVRAVFAAVEALVRGGELALSRLGRAIALRTGVKHGVKRIDRLYGNPHLGCDRTAFYRAIARVAIGACTTPVVLVDWTEAGRTTCVLAAAVPCDGRAVLVYAEAHPIATYTAPGTEAAFLENLRNVLPAGVRPIVVTDAGFRAPWLRCVERLGWHYVARIRGRTRVRPAEGGPWITYTGLYGRARIQAVDLGEWAVTRYRPYRCRLVTIRSRRRWTPIDRSLAYRSRDRAVESAREPWLLATSLRDSSARRVAALYRSRMQIEETFRDTKSRRFGWGFEASRTSRPTRVDVMFLLVALATVLVLLVGVAAESANVHRSFQANTRISRRVLALTTLGRLVLLHPIASSAVLQRLCFNFPRGLACDGG